MVFPVVWRSELSHTVRWMCIPSTYLFLFDPYSSDSFETWKLTKRWFYFYVSARFNISRAVSFFRKFDFVCNKVKEKKKKKKSSPFRNEKRQRDSAIPLSETEIENVRWRHEPLLFAFYCYKLYMCSVQFCSLLWYWIRACYWNVMKHVVQYIYIYIYIYIHIL